MLIMTETCTERDHLVLPDSHERSIMSPRRTSARQYWGEQRLGVDWMKHAWGPSLTAAVYGGKI